VRRFLIFAALGTSLLLTLAVLGYFGGGRTTAAGTVLAQATPPAETFPTSLHATRQGKITWYSKESGGFERITGIPMEELPCLKCHPGTYADGSKVDPATYQPGCKDCHVQPGAPVSDETCLRCHARQKLEMKFYSDVHRDRGFGCKDCHTSREMHGDGHRYPSMLEPGAMEIKCENCHTSDVLPHNTAHDIHQAKLDCTACHTQSIITCYNCHFESIVKAHVKRFPGPLRDLLLLVRRKDTGKVYSANMQTLVYEGKSFVAIGPYRSHTITAEGRECDECHSNAAVKEYAEKGEITVTRWDAEQGKITGAQGVIPVPPDWQEALQFDFLDYTGDPTARETDPTKWVFLKHGADMMQMLYAEPLTEEQIEKLSHKY